MGLCRISIVTHCTYPNLRSLWMTPFFFSACSGSVPSDQIVASSMSTFPPLELKLAVHSEARRPREVVANQALMPGSNICGGRLAQSITPRSCHWHRVSSLSNTLLTLAHPCLAPKCSKCCYFPPAVYQCKMMLPYLLSYPSKQVSIFKAVLKQIQDVLQIPFWEGQIEALLNFTELFSDWSMI